MQLPYDVLEKILSTIWKLWELKCRLNLTLVSKEWLQIIRSFRLDCRFYLCSHSFNFIGQHAGKYVRKVPTDPFCFFSNKHFEEPAEFCVIMNMSRDVWNRIDSLKKLQEYANSFIFEKTKHKSNVSPVFIQDTTIFSKMFIDYTFNFISNNLNTAFEKKGLCKVWIYRNETLTANYFTTKESRENILYLRIGGYPTEFELSAIFPSLQTLVFDNDCFSGAGLNLINFPKLRHLDFSTTNVTNLQEWIQMPLQTIKCTFKFFVNELPHLIGSPVDKSLQLIVFCSYELDPRVCFGETAFKFLQTRKIVIEYQGNFVGVESKSLPAIKSLWESKGLNVEFGRMPSHNH